MVQSASEISANGEEIYRQRKVDQKIMLNECSDLPLKGEAVH